MVLGIICVDRKGGQVQCEQRQERAAVETTKETRTPPSTATVGPDLAVDAGETARAGAGPNEECARQLDGLGDIAEVVDLWG